MRERKFMREIKRISTLSLNQLRARAARNKRLLRTAAECRFRKAYAMRKTLGRLYGQAIAARMRQV